MKKTTLLLAVIFLVILMAPSAMAAGTYKDIVDCSDLSAFVPGGGDTVVTEKAGSSLKITIPEPFEAWGRLNVTTSSGTTGYDGFVFRIKCTEPTGNFVFVVGTENDTCRYGGAVLYSAAGTEVEYVVATDRPGVYIPAGFDGYMFFPFSGATTTHNPASKDIMLLFINTGDMLGYDLKIDAFGAYKGTDFAAVIADMGGTVSTTSTKPTSEPTSGPTSETSSGIPTNGPSDSGISPLWFIVGGILLLGAGVVVFIIIRRRRVINNS